MATLALFVTSVALAVIGLCGIVRHGAKGLLLPALAILAIDLLLWLLIMPTALYLDSEGWVTER